MNRLLESQEQQKWEEEEHYLGGYEDWLAAHVEEQLSCEPKPIPCDPGEEETVMKGRALFSPEVLARIIGINQDWLQHTPHTTSEVLETLFPSFEAGDLGHDDILALVGDALFDAGYSPSVRRLPATWTFPV